MNGDPNGGAFNTYIPLQLTSTGARGVSSPGVYASEFGASAWASFESIAPTLAPNHWALMGGVEADNCTGGGWPSVCTGPNPM